MKGDSAQWDRIVRLWDYGTHGKAQLRLPPCDWRCLKKLLTYTGSVVMTNKMKMSQGVTLDFKKHFTM